MKLILFLCLVLFSVSVCWAQEDDFLEAIKASTWLDEHQKEAMQYYASDVLDADNPLSAAAEKWLITFTNILSADFPVDTKVNFSQDGLDQIYEAFPSSCRMIVENESIYSCEYADDCLCFYDYSCDCDSE